MTEDEADDYEAWKTGRALSAVRGRRAFQLEHDAFRSAVEPIAKKLGLRINTLYDAYSTGWHVDACLLPPRAGFTLDEELMMSCERVHLADIILRELENLQSIIFDETAKKMTELDVRGRSYGLSKDDRNTLHEMFNDAADHLCRYPQYGDQTAKDAREATRQRYMALVVRLDP